MEFEFTNDGKETFHILYDNVVKAKDLMPVTRTLAIDLVNSGYMRVGDFLKNLSDNDLQNLMEISDNDECEQYCEILLMAELLATGEGLESSSDEQQFADRMNHFCVLLAFESLQRKGLVKLYRENMTFGEDMGDKIIVEKI
jgi:hypothetical protein